MVLLKHKFFEILCNILYLMIIFSSFGFILFRFFKLNSRSILNNLATFSIKISFPQFKNSDSKKNMYNKIEKNINYEDKEFVDSDDEIRDDEVSNEKLKAKNSGDICKIFEAQFGKSGVKCGNIYVKNKTGKEINFENYLARTPKISAKNKGTPIVLIYHTHTSEGYMTKDDGTFQKNFPSRTQDNSKNVVAIGNEIFNTLKKRGISAVHDVTVHDYPNYKGAYNRSAKTVRECIMKNPGIQIAIDIHRDSMGSNQSGKIKPTFKTKNNRKASQIMFISGCGIDKSLKFPGWEKNLILSLNLQSVCEKHFPGFTRELFVKNSRYNQDITPGSILIEVGSDMNTVEESKLAAQMLGEAISIFLKKYLK